MGLSNQIRKRRLEQGITLTDLAYRSKISKGYLSQLENNPRGSRPSAEVLYRIAFALGTSIGALLEKQVFDTQNELTDVPSGLRALALAEHLSEEEIKTLARISYQGNRPDTVDDWKFLFEAIKRSVRTGSQ